MGMTQPKETTPGDRAVRAVALVGPAGTGKTSLAEALLHATGAIGRQGGVDAGNSVGDASPEARARGGSTEINLMHFDYLGDRYGLVDVPGGTGFAADGDAALACADLALVVVDPTPERAALAGPMLRRLDELGVPHAVFVNKIETARAGAVRALVERLQPMSREPLALRQIPIRSADGKGGEQVVGYVDLALERAYHYRPGSESERVEIPGDLLVREQAERTQLLETLADFDVALLEALLMDETPDLATVMHDLAVDTAGNKVVPVVLGSALAEGGVHRLLKLLRHETPAPQAAAQRLGLNAGGVCVMKISHGAAVGRLALSRVFGAPLDEGEELVVGSDSARAGAIFALQGERMTKQPRAASGEVVAIAKLEAAKAGDILGRKGGRSARLPVNTPPRNAALAIATRDRKDDVRLSTALHRLCEEDPALEWTQDEASHETILKGVNDEHLALVLARLQRRYGVAVDTRPPPIAYRESIRRAVTQRGRHRKQSGGHGQYGDCVIEIRPLERGEGLRFEEQITGGAIPKQYIPAVEMGVRDACGRGPMGFPVVDVAVTLVDGSFHSVDSSELAFRIAGRMAMSEAMARASPYLLEPVMRVTVETPEGTGSRVGSLLSSRRGQILGMGQSPEPGDHDRVEAMLPESALHGLDAELRSISQGLARFAAAFDHLAEVGGKLADDIVKTRAAQAA